MFSDDDLILSPYCKFVMILQLKYEIDVLAGRGLAPCCFTLSKNGLASPSPARRDFIGNSEEEVLEEYQHSTRNNAFSPEDARVFPRWILLL